MSKAACRWDGCSQESGGSIWAAFNSNGSCYRTQAERTWLTCPTMQLPINTDILKMLLQKTLNKSTDLNWRIFWLSWNEQQTAFLRRNANLTWSKLPVSKVGMKTISSVRTSGKDYRLKYPIALEPSSRYQYFEERPQFDRFVCLKNPSSLWSSWLLCSVRWPTVWIKKNWSKLIEYLVID